MYISKVTLRNFRNFKKATFKFNKSINTLIGENGSGKTNVFDAIRLLIDDSIPRNATFLKESDFNRALGNWRGQWIVISLEFSDLNLEETIMCLATHGIGVADEESRGNYNFYFRPKKYIRKTFFDISSNDETTIEEKDKLIKEQVSKINIFDYESVITCKAINIDFDNDDFYEKHVGNFETLIFSNPDDLAEDELGIRKEVTSFSLYNDISCTFAEALRDVVYDLRNYKNSPLIALLKSQENMLDADEQNDLLTKAKDLNDAIGGLKSVSELTKGIGKTLKKAVGETYAPALDIKANLPSDISKLIQALILQVGDPDDLGYIGRIEELSLGGANLIYLALKLHLYSLSLPQNKSAYILLIEEPEAHIHTHIQKTLFQKNKDSKAQVIYSTHSTQISEVSKISSVNIISKKSSFSEVYQPSNNLCSKKIIKLERYLDANRCNLLFSKGAILVEGDAEMIMIPTIVSNVFGFSLDELGISLINIGSTSFENVANIFHQDRVRKKCSIITDEDKSYLPLPDDSSTDTAEQKKCRESHNSGHNRKIELDAYCNDPQRFNWVKPFYAEHTFEVDIIKCGNANYVTDTLNDLYSTDNSEDFQE